MNIVIDSLEYLFYSQLAFWLIMLIYLAYISRKLNGKD